MSESKLERPTKVPAHVEFLAKQVITAALAVHRELGPGFLESVYEEALSIELKRNSVPFARQVEIGVAYRDTVVGLHRLDFLIGGTLVVELKALETILPIHKAQVISYLKAGRHPLGLLVNFNSTLLKNGLSRIVHPSLL